MITIKKFNPEPRVLNSKPENHNQQQERKAGLAALDSANNSADCPSGKTIDTQCAEARQAWLTSQPSYAYGIAEGRRQGIAEGRRQQIEIDNNTITFKSVSENARRLTLAEVEKDREIARRCLEHKCILCRSKECINYICPLNKSKLKET